jgi:hypothetical protein
MLLCVGRVKEKVLLGEMDADTSTLEALRPHTGGLGGSSSMFEPFNTTKSSSRSSTRRGLGNESPTTSVWKEPLVNSSIQASEEDIEKFTDVTVGQSWVLPSVVNRSKKKAKQADSSTATDSQTDLPSKQPKMVNGIPEQSFDDFEPFIVVPRSPRSASANKYRPNLKELPMPTPGAPEGTSKKQDVFRQTTPAATKPKKVKSTSNLHHDKAKDDKKKIEFQEISLKKTTLSKQEAAQLHLAEFRDEGGVSADEDGQNATKGRPQSQGGAGGVKKKKKPTNKAATAPPGAFFFPTLLSAAPSINLGPIGGSLSDDNAFLYEDTSAF